MEDTFNRNLNRRVGKKPIFTTEMKKELKEIYHLRSIEELAVHFDRSVRQIKNQVSRQYLTKRDK